MDRASNSQGSGASLILVSSDGFVTEQVLRFNFNTFNNDAEYEALTVGKWQKSLGSEN